MMRIRSHEITDRALMCLNVELELVLAAIHTKVYQPNPQLLWSKTLSKYMANGF